jgi:endonuclease YncB( thermonuclease family)
MTYAICPLHSSLALPAVNAPAIVQHIIDGDTFSARVKLENNIEISVRVRMLNIDAPELTGECESEIAAAVASKNRLAELIPPGDTVQLANIKDDKYLGRINANVISDGRDIGQIMISENHARPYNGKKRNSWCD